MSVRPYHVFLMIWTLMAYLFYFDSTQEKQRAQERIQYDKRVAGKVIRAHEIRNHLWSVDLVIPPSFGITKCNISVFLSKYEALNGTMDLLVGQLDNGEYYCWSVRDVTGTATKTTEDNLGRGIFLGFPMTIFLYYFVVRIRFGSPRRSTKTRWEEESLFREL
jgi:hypothetical protein